MHFRSRPGSINTSASQGWLPPSAGIVVDFFIHFVISSLHATSVKSTLLENMYKNSVKCPKETREGGNEQFGF